MKKLRVLSLMGVLSAILPGTLGAQGWVKIEKQDGKTVKIPMTAVETMQTSTQRHEIDVAYPAENVKGVNYGTVVNESQVRLDGADRLTGQNLITAVSLAKSSNPSLGNDVTLKPDGSGDVTLVVPCVASGTKLTLDVETIAPLVYIDGKLGNSTVTVGKTAKVQAVAYTGDVNTLNVTVVNTSLPVLEIKNSSAISKDWSEELTIVEDGRETGKAKVKGKGSKFASGAKNNYALKFDSKTPVLGMLKNKRWLLNSQSGDKTLLRERLGYELSAMTSKMGWTPQSVAMELVIDGKYAGTYVAVEQPRVCKGRIEDGVLMKTETKADNSDDFFSTQGGQLLVIEDPETGTQGTALVRTKDLIDNFEKLLQKGNYTEAKKLIDLNSFVAWVVVNEIAKNTDAFVEDSYLHVGSDGLLHMGPVWNLGKAFGCEDDETEGFDSAGSLWIAMLMKDSQFASDVKSTFASLYKQKTSVKDKVQKLKEQTEAAAVCNDAVWGSLGTSAYEKKAEAYGKEVDRLNQWLDARMEWLNTQWK